MSEQHLTETEAMTRGEGKIVHSTDVQAPSPGSGMILTSLLGKSCMLQLRGLNWSHASVALTVHPAYWQQSMKSTGHSHTKPFALWPPAAGDDSDFGAVGRRGVEVTGGPPLLFAGAAHVEDIPEMERQHLIGRAQIWRTSVVVEQRSAETKRNKRHTRLVQNQNVMFDNISRLDRTEAAWWCRIHVVILMLKCTSPDGFHISHTIKHSFTSVKERRAASRH